MWADARQQPCNTQEKGRTRHEQSTQRQAAARRTPLGCTLPIFLITVGAALTAGPVGSLALFAAYSLGMGLVLTAVALGAALFRGVVSTTPRRVLPYVQQVSALLLVVAGAYLVWSNLPGLLA